ncbi:MAG: aminoglycoside phosphotransferase family protein [Eggerthellaceae bacterium]|nr:aminoglycoside phosphotransferase family protein [Eggerthellaceae bacterium]
MDSFGSYDARLSRYLDGNEELKRAIGATAQDELRICALGEGEHNINYRLSVKGHEGDAQSYVLRVNVLPQPFHECQVRYEYDALKAVAPSSRTPLPIYMDASPAAPGEGVLVETFCPGKQLDLDRFAQEDMRKCARIMADIHSAPVDADTPIFRPADPLRDLYAECVERIDVYKASEYEDARITRWADLFSKLTLEAIEEAGVPDDEMHIVNTEPLAAHFLLTSELDPPGYFVDWERPIVSEVAQDLAFFLAPTTTFWDSGYLMPASEIDGILKMYWQAVDGRFPAGRFQERFPAWLKCSIFRAIAWCCKALIRYGSADAHKTDKAAAKLPIYLSDEFLENMLDAHFR